mgnify:FL=1
MGNVKGVELREVTPSDVDEDLRLGYQAWYVNEFAGNAIPTPETHRAYFDNVFKSGACYLAVEYDGVHIGCAGVKYIEERTR